MENNEKYLKVRIGSKYNLSNYKGEYISDCWYDFISEFREGYCVVEDNLKFNFMDEEGYLLTQEWFDFVYPFSEGFAQVEVEGKWSYISKNGKHMNDERYESCSKFKNGVAYVVINDKYYYINRNGKILNKEGFDSAFIFFDYDTAMVTINGLYNLVDRNMNVILEVGYDRIAYIDGGIYAVSNDKGWRFINKRGELLNEMEFFEIGTYYNGLLKVMVCDKYNLMDSDGKLLFEEFVNEITQPDDHPYCYLYD